MNKIPVRGLRPSTKLLLGLGAVVLAGGFIALAAGGPAAGPTLSPSRGPIPAAITSFDRAAFDAYWRQWDQTSWGRLVTSVEPDGYGVTAHTKLFPDGDARAPALSICAAVAAFWAGRDDAPAVRVLDQADDILASTYSGEAAGCAYRR